MRLITLSVHWSQLKIVHLLHTFDSHINKVSSNVGTSSVTSSPTVYHLYGRMDIELSLCISLSLCVCLVVCTQLIVHQQYTTIHLPWIRCIAHALHIAHLNDAYNAYVFQQCTTHQEAHPLASLDQPTIHGTFITLTRWALPWYDYVVDCIYETFDWNVFWSIQNWIHLVRMREGANGIVWTHTGQPYTIN